MPSSSYCGPSGPLFPGGGIKPLLDGECFVSGFLLCLPFSLALFALLACAVQKVFCRKSRQYLNIQDDEQGEDDAVQQEMGSGFESSFFAGAALQLHWVFAFGLIGCGLVQIAQLVTLESFEWYQLTSALARAAGVLLCLSLYTIGGEHPPKPLPLITTLFVWALNSAAAALWVRWFVVHHALNHPRLSFVVAVVYLALSGLLVICDAFLLLILCCQGGDYEVLATEDPDADPALNIPPSTIVARHLDDPELYYAHDKVNFLARITYTYMTDLLVEAYKKPIQMPRLGKLPLFDSCSTNFRAVYRRWKQQIAMQRGLLDQVSLQRPLWREYAVPMLVAYVLKQTADLLGFVGPVALKGIVQFMVERQTGTYTPPDEASLRSVLANGWVLAIIMFLAPFMQSTLLQIYYYITIRVSANAQSALMSMIYHKALALNMETLPADVTTGSIVSHMSVDVTTIGLLFQFIHYIFTTPIQMGITLYLLYWNIGWAGPASLSVILVLLPIQFILARLTARVQKHVLAENDGRLKLVNELLQGIKIIKFYAWEATFVERITNKRAKQLRLLLWRKLVGAATICLAVSTPSLITVTGFGLFTLWSDTPLTAAVAFSALSLFNILLMPMFILPGTISAWINCVVSGKRIMKFLLMPTMDRSFYHPDLDAANPIAIEVAGTFKWNLSAGGQAEAVPIPPPEASEPSAPLDAPRPDKFDFEVQVPRGTLTMIVGPVGSGKSTLVKTMLGDVPCDSGAVYTHGRLAYVPQQATIFNATVQNNILFGREMNQQEYDQVLAASGLLQDLQILTSGDMTEIGEKGINLSGGQKQRVSIARALYSQADVVIFDDPLSALDAHVGELVFKEAVMKMLLDKGKTVVMVTHQLQYLRHAQQILLIRDNAIKARGTMEELTAAGFDLQHEAYQPEESPVTEAGEPEELAEDFRRSFSKARDRAISTASALRSRAISRATSGRSQLSIEEEEPDPDKGKLIQEEDREVGAVGLHVYMTYFRAGGAVWVGILFLVQITAKVINVLSSLFLSHWSNESTHPTEAHPVGYYLGIFTAITLTSTVVSGVGNSFTAVTAVRASKVLHHRMLDCITRCPMAFFDTTPVGRVINRFSNDIQNVDQMLSEMLNQSFQMILNLVACLITMVIINPWLGILLLPVAVLYWFIQHFFRCTSRELQRLNNISKSPIFAHLSETLGGITTIRTYGAAPRFTMLAMKHVDTNVTAFLTLTSANRWLGLRLDCLGAIIVSSTALACIWKANTLAPGLAGLSLTYALSFVGFVSFTIRAIADAEMQMSSVERIAHYTNLDTEMPQISAPPTSGVPPSWPHAGEITIRNLNATYRPGLPLVLKGVSVKIKGGERVGVCGRTGSGKTSLLLALFRMLRIEGGHIAIDGVDIMALPLQTLRSRMAVIPQDPVLFAGTVRYNLDPSSIQTDEKLWDALRVAQLADAVQSLDDEVIENGENFSTGQRQLFCLARAFLKHTRILCLDEATASVDQETDKVIQGLIRTLFTKCTIVTIAHRISTILDYNKVLVLGDGRVLEFDTPSALLQTDSVFKSLVDAANKGDE